MVKSTKIYDVISDYQFYAYYEPLYNHRDESPGPVLIARFQARESNRFHEGDQLRLNREFILDPRYYDQPLSWISKIDHALDVVNQADTIIDHVLVYCTPFNDPASWEVEKPL